jgi:hypothetical protein
MRRLLAASLLASAFTLLPGLAHAAPPRVAVSAEVACLTDGGISIDLTVENTGSRMARIDPDLHLVVEAIRRGRQPGVVLFVFPVPDFARIPPGESRTFLLTAGEPFEGFPATDFSGSRILVEVEVWLRGREHPVTRTLAFSACSRAG